MNAFMDRLLEKELGCGKIASTVQWQCRQSSDPSTITHISVQSLSLKAPSDLLMWQKEVYHFVNEGLFP